MLSSIYPHSFIHPWKRNVEHPLWRTFVCELQKLSALQNLNWKHKQIICFPLPSRETENGIQTNHPRMWDWFEKSILSIIQKWTRVDKLDFDQNATFNLVLASLWNQTELTSVDHSNPFGLNSHYIYSENSNIYQLFQDVLLETCDHGLKVIFPLERKINVVKLSQKCP